MKAVRFLLEAEVELIAEATYYEERTPGPGRRFIAEIQAVVALASAFPEIGSPYRYGTRRVLPKRFPFAVVYRSLSAESVIMGIAPFSRKPAYWRGRKFVE